MTLLLLLTCTLASSTCKQGSVECKISSEKNFDRSKYAPFWTRTIWLPTIYHTDTANSSLLISMMGVWRYKKPKNKIKRFKWNLNNTLEHLHVTTNGHIDLQEISSDTKKIWHKSYIWMYRNPIKKKCKNKQLNFQTIAKLKFILTCFKSAYK